MFIVAFFLDFSVHSTIRYTLHMCAWYVVNPLKGRDDNWLLGHPGLTYMFNF